MWGQVHRSLLKFCWRTMFIVPELEKEARILSSSSKTRKKLKLLRGERDKIEDQLHHLKWSLEYVFPGCGKTGGFGIKIPIC
ncbi:putative HAD-superfamily hydrolase, subfamily IG, 5'-nucleotidase, HAD-like superfamily [Helianthus annuus]|nr:putative HAD-superfamily hydrolase, subfamily IG, 5'-nucleotidase, HAD-like superfamily [Helianthus annuus]